MLASTFQFRTPHSAAIPIRTNALGFPRHNLARSNHRTRSYQGAVTNSRLEDIFRIRALTNDQNVNYSFCYWFHSILDIRGADKPWNDDSGESIANSLGIL